MQYSQKGCPGFCTFYTKEKKLKKFLKKVLQFEKGCATIRASKDKNQKKERLNKNEKSIKKV